MSIVNVSVGYEIEAVNLEYR